MDEVATSLYNEWIPRAVDNVEMSVAENCFN